MTNSPTFSSLFVASPITVSVAIRHGASNRIVRPPVMLFTAEEQERAVHSSTLVAFRADAVWDELRTLGRKRFDAVTWAWADMFARVAMQGNDK